MLTLVTRCGIVLAALAPVAACSDYLDRRDTLLLGAGEAVQTNIVTHQIDPWPAHARHVYADTNGERAQRAIERYRNPQTSADAGSAEPVAVTPTPVGEVAPSR